MTSWSELSELADKIMASSDIEELKELAVRAKAMRDKLDQDYREAKEEYELAEERWNAIRKDFPFMAEIDPVKVAAHRIGAILLGMEE